MKPTLFAALFVGCLTLRVSMPAGAAAAAAAGELGMKAPALEIAEWVKGTAVDPTAGRGTNLHVVEFWATWCPPCRASIPHLSELQKRFKDRGVIIVGISDEPSATVKPFVDKMGDSMAYTVAVDRERRTMTNYMLAFGQDGIPHAFVVDKQGKVAWHGHPMNGLDDAIEDLLEGRYDIEAAKRAAAAEKSMAEYFRMASAQPPDSKARELGERILKDLSSNQGLLNEFAWILLTHPRLKQRDLDLAGRAAKAAYEGSEGKDPSIADTYARALFMGGKVTEAIALQKKAIAACTDDQIKPQLEQALAEYEAKAAEAEAKAKAQ